jgi:anti-sigma factor RsiW
MSGQGPTCHEVVELITEYLEDALPPTDRRRVEEHLALCDGCDGYLDQMRQTIRLTGMLTEEQVPDVQKAALLEAFRSWAG